MCLIVDANNAAEFFSGTNPDFTEIYSFVLKHGCCIVYGGKLKEELIGVESVRRALLVLDKAGKAKAISDSEVKRVEKEILEAGLCKSNDAHVIALAQVSGCRLVCTADEALQHDVKNPALLNAPRGKIYKNASHKHLLRKHCHAC